ncbi:hypothetical protein VTO42DRAFT_5359 [Malbranchea cinnamomea]
MQQIPWNRLRSISPYPGHKLHHGVPLPPGSVGIWPMVRGTSTCLRIFLCATQRKKAREICDLWHIRVISVSHGWLKAVLFLCEDKRDIIM